ncbi:MAG: hypothetical protein ABWK05_03250 [Pyrobaculum sp.]
MMYVVLGLLLLAVGVWEPVFKPVATPLGLFFLGYGVGGVLHKLRRHVAGYVAAFLGVAAAIWTAPFPAYGPAHKALLIGVAFGFLLNAVRFFLKRGRRVLAPVSVATVAGFLGAFLQLVGFPVAPFVVWGVGLGGAAASALGLLRGRRGRFFARRTAFFGALGGLLALLYQVSLAIGRPAVFAGAAAASVAAVLILGGDLKTRVRPYDDPDVLEAKRAEATFLKTGDAALLAAYVAYHLARSGADERAVAEAVRAAVSYKDLKPSPFAPPLVAKLVEKYNRRRRARHLERVKATLRRYL